MNKTLEEWIKFYEEKTSQKFERDERFKLFYLPDKGFCEIMQTEKMTVINQLSGDGKFWKNFAEKIARINNSEMLGSWYIRKNVRAYMRLFGFKIIGEEILSDQLKRYRSIDKDGNKGLMSPSYDAKTKKHVGYFVTWEVK